MSLSDTYLKTVHDLLDRVAVENTDSLKEASERIAASLAEGGVLHVFGSGHSGIVSQELVHRAGGLVPVSAILDPSFGSAEKTAGYGDILFRRYQERFPAQPGEVLIVVSNSGRNPSPVEIASRARETGLFVIGITSLTISTATTPLVEGAKRLFEVVDLVLDNGVPVGDAAVEIPEHPEARTGPVSTFAGAILMNLLALDVIEALQARGVALPILRSANTPGGFEHNARLSEQYRGRLDRPM